MRTYLVTGIHPVLGHKPGTKFTAFIPRAQEEALIAGRGIVRVAKNERRVEARITGDSENIERAVRRAPRKEDQS